MTSGSNRIRGSHPTPPLGDASRLTIRIRDVDLQEVPLPALARLARALGANADRDEGEADGAYRHRLRRAVLRLEARLARGLPPLQDGGLCQTPKIG